MMDVPTTILVVGWGGFAVVFMVAGIFSTFYVRYYRNRHLSEVSITLTGIFALTFTLATLVLTPVDIFLVSSMKDANGTFQPWAESNETRLAVENTILYSYYALYGILTLFLFLVIPFLMFYYEENDEDVTTSAKCFDACKYTACFLAVAGVLLLVGAFVPTSMGTSEANSTAWHEIEFLIKEFGDSRGESALYFLIGFVTLIGMLAVALYTSYGMAYLPIDMLRGTRDVSDELEEVRQQRSENESARRRLESQHGNRRHARGRPRRQLDDLEDERLLIQRSETRLEQVQEAQQRWCYKFWSVWWPLRIALAIVFILIEIFILLSVFLTCLDRAMHSLGPKTGYVLPKRTLPNPMDSILLKSQVAFPLDFIIFTSLLLFFMIASLAGIRQLGIRCCCITFKMFKVRPHHTKPQGLLYMCTFLMFILVALNVFMYNLVPDYLSFGNQKYIPANSTTPKLCSTSEPNDCVLTVTTGLLTKFIYKLWFFGVCYYWLLWVFVGLIFIFAVVVLVRKPRSVIEGEVESSDLEDSDEEMVSP